MRTIALQIIRTALLAAIFVLTTGHVFASGVVNINTADAAALDTLPGIGPTKAAAIVDYRTSHGPFTTIEAIQNVKGIGPATFEKLKDHITVAGTTVVETAKPSPVATSYTRVQTDDTPVINQNTSTYEPAVIAPATSSELAAAGAALPKDEHTTGIFHSPWAYGLLGVVLVAGSAFIFF